MRRPCLWTVERLGPKSAWHRTVPLSGVHNDLTIAVAWFRKRDAQAFIKRHDGHKLGWRAVKLFFDGGDNE